MKLLFIVGFIPLVKGESMGDMLRFPFSTTRGSVADLYSLGSCMFQGLLWGPQLISHFNYSAALRVWPRAKKGLKAVGIRANLSQKGICEWEGSFVCFAKHSPHARLELATSRLEV